MGAQGQVRERFTATASNGPVIFHRGRANWPKNRRNSKTIDKWLFSCDKACESSRIHERRFSMKKYTATPPPDIIDGAPKLQMQCSLPQVRHLVLTRNSHFMRIPRASKAGQTAAGCKSHLKDIPKIELTPSTGGPLGTNNPKPGGGLLFRKIGRWRQRHLTLNYNNTSRQSSHGYFWHCFPETLIFVGSSYKVRI
jgi:hypothetical protein